MVTPAVHRPSHRQRRPPGCCQNPEPKPCWWAAAAPRWRPRQRWGRLLRPRARPHPLTRWPCPPHRRTAPPNRRPHPPPASRGVKVRPPAAAECWGHQRHSAPRRQRPVVCQTPSSATHLPVMAGGQQVLPGLVAIIVVVGVGCSPAKREDQAGSGCGPADAGARRGERTPAVRPHLPRLARRTWQSSPPPAPRPSHARAAHRGPGGCTQGRVHATNTLSRGPGVASSMRATVASKAGKQRDKSAPPTRRGQAP